MNFIGSNQLALAAMPAHGWERVYWVPGGCDAVPPPKGAEYRETITGDMLSTAGTVVIGYREIIPIFRTLPIVGCHPSLLPLGRGRCPIQWTILNDEFGGLTFFRMTQEVDAGPILAQISMGRFASSEDLYQAGCDVAPELLAQAIRAWADNGWTGIPQRDKYPARKALVDKDQKYMPAAMKLRVYSGPYSQFLREVGP